MCGQPAVDDEPDAGHEGGIVGGERQRSGEAPGMVALAEGRRECGREPINRFMVRQTAIGKMIDWVRDIALRG